LPERNRTMRIITGPPHSGKTSLVLKRVRALRAAGKTVAGIAAKGLWADGVRSGFDLTDLGSDITTPLCRRIPDGGLENGIPFSFDRAGLEAGFRALFPDVCRNADMVVVDEVGVLELSGKGWAACLKPLLRACGPNLVWIVQSALVTSVCRMWNLTPQAIISAEEPDALKRLEAVNG